MKTCTNIFLLTLPNNCMPLADELPPSLYSPSKDVDYEDGRGGMSSLVIVVVTVVGMAVLMLNVLLIGCCLHRRANKRLTGKYATCSR